MAQISIQQAFGIAVQHHQAGRLQEAENLYRQILAQQPGHFDALHFLGVIAHQVGRHDIAVDLIRRAISLQPNFPQAYLNLGNALKDKGELDEAIAAFRQSIALQPNIPLAFVNLGNALSDRGELKEAIAAYRQAIVLNPGYADAHGNLGIALQEKGDLHEAISAFRQAIALDPTNPKTQLNLGNALKNDGKLDEAIAVYRGAVALRPDYAEGHSNLGNALKAKKQFDEAITAYRKAISLNPNLPEIHSNLGNALSDSGQLDEAIAAYRHAIAIRPDYAQAHSNLGVALKDMGQVDEAIAAYRQALALLPGYAEAHSNLLLALHYHPGYDARFIAEEHRRWDRQHAQALAKFIQPHLNNRDTDRPLRIGYVSPDFRDHAVGRFILPLLAAHDREAFEIFGYAQVPVADKMTAKLKTHCSAWRSLVNLSDERAAEIIREDQIDILVDLAAHTADNRLLVFARKPAPVQTTWLGYPDTTGMSAMDYRFTDAFADPPDQNDEFCAEQVIRLPQTNWCFAPPEDGPPANELPAIANQGVTFGSFNNFAKVTDAMLKLWAEILRQTPGSKLLLKAKPLGCLSVQQRVRQVMNEAGIEPDRLMLMGLAPSALYLAQYHRIDIALDTYPYHGTTTTCEALWMGVPVVSLAGQTHVSRVGISLLNDVGLPELLAETPQQYVRIAVDLANDLPRLAQLRSTLRRRLEQSPLMDAPNFARNVEAAYRLMWRTWCEKISNRG